MIPCNRLPVVCGYYFFLISFLFVINSDDGVWENANHSKPRLEIVICAHFMHEIEHNFPFVSLDFLLENSKIYTKRFSIIFHLAKVWNVTRTLHAFWLTCRQVSFSTRASKYHTGRQCCGIDKRLLKRKIGNVSDFLGPLNSFSYIPKGIDT